VRISLDKTSDEANVRRQERDCLDYCERHRIKVVEVCRDNDVSASKYARKKRPGYQRVLQLIDDDVADTIVTWHFDRLYRQPKELEGLIDRVDKFDLQVVTLFGDIDLNQSTGRLTARVLAGVSANESDNTSRRVKRQKAENRESGKPHGGRAYGWIDGMTPDDAQAEIVRELFRRYAEGESLSALANDLNARMIPQANGGSHWYPTQVRSILSRHRHVGLVATTDPKTGATEVVGPANWPALVDRKTFNRVQALLARRGDRLRGTPRRATLLTGLVRCSKCGHPLRRQKSAESRSVLACRGGAVGPGCGSISIGAQMVEDLVTETILSWADSSELSRLVAAQHSDESTARAISDEIALLDAKSADLDELWLNGKLADARYSKQTKALDERRETLSARLLAASASSTVSPLLARRGALRASWPDLSVARRRDVIATLLELNGTEIVVTPATPPRTIPNPDRVRFRTKRKR
jgi:site-specific DNA recombinase